MTPRIHESLSVKSFQEAEALRRQLRAESERAALKQILQGADRILSHRPVRVIDAAGNDAPHGAPSWTDGADVYLNREMIDLLFNTKSLEEAILTLKGTNYHELAHILFTPRRDDPLFAEIFSHGWKYFRPFNMLEDQRIETLYTANFAATTPYFTHAIYHWLLQNQDKLAGVYPLIVGRKYIAKKIRLKARAASLVLNGSQWTVDVENIINEYILLPLPARAERAVELVKAFADLINSATDIPDNGGCGTCGGEGGRSRVEEGEINTDDVVDANVAVRDKVEEDDADEGDDTDADDVDDRDDEGDDEFEDYWDDEDDESDDFEDSDGEGDWDDESDEDDDEADGNSPEGDSEGVDSGDDTDSDSADESGSEGDQDGAEGDDDTDSDEGDSEGEGDGSEGDEGDDDGESDGESDGEGEGGSGDDSDENSEGGSDDEGGEGQSDHGDGDMNVDDLADEIKDAVTDALTDVMLDENFKKDVQTTTDSFRDLVERKTGDEQITEYEKFVDRPAPADAQNAARRIATTLRQLKTDLDPQWENNRSSGRVNVARVIRHMANPSFDEIYERWYEGDEDAASTEVVITLDLSTSMKDQIDQCSQSLWVLKRAFDEVGIRTTVLGFSSNQAENVTLYKPTDKVHRTEYRSFLPFSGTHAMESCKTAQRILHRSQATNKVFIAITDGAWERTFKDGDMVFKADPIVGSMRTVLHVETVLFCLKDSYSTGTHNFETVVEARQVTDIVTIAKNLVTNLMKKAARAR